jgi:hypothetical protein
MTLRTRLDDLAADAPGTDALDLGALRGRITRRRRGRLATVGGAVAVTVAAAGTAVATLMPGLGDPDGAPVATAPAEQQAFRFGDCGESVTSRGPLPAGPLEMTVQPQPPVPEGGSYIALATVTVTNVSDETITASTGDGPGVLLAEPGGGRVTAQEPVQTVITTVDLAPGESTTATASLYRYRCVPGEPVHASDGGLVQPGRYEAYVVWGMTTDDGAEIVLHGGPFTVDLP